jgi:hypothetical protein
VDAAAVSLLCCNGLAGEGEHGCSCSCQTEVTQHQPATVNTLVLHTPVALHISAHGNYTQMTSEQPFTSTAAPGDPPVNLLTLGLKWWLVRRLLAGIQTCHAARHLRSGSQHAAWVTVNHSTQHPVVTIC